LATPAGRKRVGDKVTLTLIRDGQQMTLEAVLDAR